MDLYAASRGSGCPRRLASSTIMDAVQISPSTVNSISRTVAPTSSWNHNGSNACWYEMTATVPVGRRIDLAIACNFPEIPLKASGPQLAYRP